MNFARIKYGLCSFPRLRFQRENATNTDRRYFHINNIRRYMSQNLKYVPKIISMEPNIEPHGFN